MENIEISLEEEIERLSSSSPLETKLENLVTSIMIIFLIGIITFAISISCSFGYGVGTALGDDLTATVESSIDN